MPKIIAISLNTAIDTIIKIDKFEIGSVTRALSREEFASGKAVNTIKSISSFSIDKKLIGFCGQDFLAILKETSNIDQESLELITIDNRTRQNITLIENSTNTLLSHIQTEGYIVLESNIELLFNIIRTNLNDNDIVILSGSLPSGFNIKDYKKLINVIKEKDTTLILDTSGEALRCGCECSPDVIKPNLDELSYLTGVDKTELALSKIKTISEQIIKEYSIGHVFITMGDKGAIYNSKNSSDVLYGVIEESFKDTIGDEIGCGDSFIGGIALAFSEGKIDKEILKCGIALATSNLYAFGPGNIDKSKYDLFINKIKTVIL